MQLDKYIVVEGRENRYGNIELKARMVEKTPKLKGNEIAIRLLVDVPRALFQRPTLTAKMDIPDEAVPEIKLSPEVTANIEEIIKQSTGLTMSVKVIPFEEKSENQE
jgi:hypothetical protein